MAPGAGKKRERSDEPQEEQQPAKRATLEQYNPLALPSGWERCPRLGHAVKIAGLTFIPSKVPLGDQFSENITPGRRYTPYNAYDHAREAGHEVGLVIDLTNTTRFYDAAEWSTIGEGIQYIKIRCRGRGEVPEPEAVNYFYWMVGIFHNLQKCLVKETPGYKPKAVLVHCTHGFNRTGYMIVNYLVRKGYRLTKSIETFAKCRSPGIYKDDYLASLYQYYHERRPTSMAQTPAEPDWKAGAPASPEHDLEWDGDAPAAGAEPANGHAKQEMKHDDVVGEAVCEQEALEAQKWATAGIIGQNLERLEPWANPDGSWRFAGSQPVSLARSNQGLLAQRRYFATWKADGTRFLLLIFGHGAYLLDRSMQVRRVQLRCPTKKTDSKSPLVAGPQHHNTLLDGEMVVDTDKNGVQRRRFLAYDIMTLTGRHVADYSFEDRFRLLDESVERPRDVERAQIAKESRLERRHRHHPEYDYGAETFSVRRKNFWPLTQVRKLLDNFIPGLSHESDGLIFQGYADPYKPGTCEELLKWKFAHLNSVDFLLHSLNTGPQLLLMKTRGHGGLKPLPDAKLHLPGDQHMGDLHGKIIECSWGGEDIGWTFMRVRVDKSTPNAWHVYEKVWQSIKDDIGTESILQCIDESIQDELYEADRTAAEAAARAKQ